jgi:acetoin utilization deacetylase AcuC-like enzyme
MNKQNDSSNDGGMKFADNQIHDISKLTHSLSISTADVSYSKSDSSSSTSLSCSTSTARSSTPVQVDKVHRNIKRINNSRKIQKLFRTGLFYDIKTLLHQANYRHVESPLRIQHTYNCLKSAGVLDKCLLISSNTSADNDDIQLDNSQSYPSFVPSTRQSSIKSNAQGDQSVQVHKQESALNDDHKCSKTPTLNSILHDTHDAELIQQILDSRSWEYGEDESDSECEEDPTKYCDCVYIDEDTFVNKHSSVAAETAVGGLITLCDKVMQNELDNAFALIRPPGHHADRYKSQGTSSDYC